MGKAVARKLTVELPPGAYRRLREQADHLGRPPRVIAQEWLVERLTPPLPTPDSDCEKACQALRAAGLLVEMSPGLRARADSTVPLERVEAALARAGGKPLSQIVLEQRGPKG